jgi:hypothetical protein
MIHRNLWVALLLPFVGVACGPGHVIVTAETEVFDPESGETEVREITDLPIQLLPFDRDFVFDSLTQAAPRPEPQMSPELVAKRDSILVARQEHRAAETRWLDAREELQSINQEIQQYNPGEARYRELFTRFGTLESVEADAARAREAAFERFTRLEQETNLEMQQFRVQLEGWEDEAFEAYDEVVAVRLAAARREILADTTRATGVAEFRPPPGEWWVYARFRTGLEELYWNIRVNVERGDPSEVRLNRANATIRDVF